uniref:Uncharacterized protein n=1 Tax=Palpitomonas bilix TaxID=652834 RepID=A0A7S3D943_9EUKA|mmetsp:Transcript_27316/g.70289  ORF Transcript_27316/g.70289 Transcript_27316/m.70289 type:complete len:170 (+) Transcript_27316:89-598(+)
MPNAPEQPEGEGRNDNGEEARPLQAGAAVYNDYDEAQLAAAASLEQLRPEMVAEMRGFRLVPRPIALPLIAACRWLGDLDVSAEQVRAMSVAELNEGRLYRRRVESMNNAFLHRLRAITVGDLDDSHLEFLESLMEDEDFAPARIQRMSQAAYLLYRWLEASLAMARMQ